MVLCLANSGDTDQMPRLAASDLGMHCKPMSHKKDARLIRVNLKERNSIFLNYPLPYIIIGCLRITLAQLVHVSDKQIKVKPV